MKIFVESAFLHELLYNSAVRLDNRVEIFRRRFYERNEFIQLGDKRTFAGRIHMLAVVFREESKC